MSSIERRQQQQQQRLVLLMIVGSLCALACVPRIVLAANEQQQAAAKGYYPQYAGYDEQPIGGRFPTGYPAPAAPAGVAGQQQPLNYADGAYDYVAAPVAPANKVRHSVAGHVKNLASVVGQSGKRMLQDAQPVLLDFKSDLAQAKERIKLSQGVIKVQNVAAPLVARGQERFSKMFNNINDRRQKYNSRKQQQQPLPQYQPQDQAADQSHY